MRPIPTVVGMGETQPYFWMNAIDTKEPAARQHIAFTAESQFLFSHISFWILPILTDITYTDAEQVRQFHAAALKAGATCNGEPGLRKDYHPGYYGAFVIHPGTNVNFEVVCHSGA